jgi:hypothetical protein
VRAYPEACRLRFSGKYGHMREAKVEANERIRATQEELGIDSGNRLPFLCECDDAACRTIVRVTASEYTGARTAGRYVVYDGHPATGRVVTAGDGYAIIEG